MGFNRDHSIPRKVLLYFSVISFFVRSQRRSLFLLNSLLMKSIREPIPFKIILMVQALVKILYHLFIIISHDTEFQGLMGE